MAKLATRGLPGRHRVLLRETKQENIIDDVYERCVANMGKPLPVPGDPHEGRAPRIENVVKDIYAPLHRRTISRKITELLTPKGINAEVRIVSNRHRGIATPARSTPVIGISPATIRRPVATAW